MNIGKLLMAVARKDYAAALLVILQGWKGTVRGQQMYDRLMTDAAGTLPF